MHHSFLLCSVSYEEQVWRRRKLSQSMVPREGIEPPTRCSSGTCSTTELPRHTFQDKTRTMVPFFLCLSTHFATFLTELPTSRLFDTLKQQEQKVQNPRERESMESLKGRLSELESAYNTALSQATTHDQLEQVRVTYLGRKGQLQECMQALRKLPDEQKREIGPAINQVKERLLSSFSARQQKLQEEAWHIQVDKEANFDVTAYKPGNLKGGLHPLTQMLERIEDIFTSMGYVIADGPEVETEWYNFEALNIPADHPARDMWDTFFLDVPGLLMRTHTSPVQIRHMENNKPPFALIAPGRCYRHEATDATHDITFMQLEGLLVDKNISIGDLLGTVQQFLQTLFDKKDLEIRVRPSYFPFVEPGLEIDASCPLCKNGCSVCKKTGWIEISGAGRVHPKVLKACNINPAQYSGFAFGCGLTRLAMILYHINDIRLLHTPHLEFLEQF